MLGGSKGLEGVTGAGVLGEPCGSKGLEGVCKCESGGE